MEKMLKKLEKMKQRYETECEKVKAYEQIIQIHSAYLGILLKALEATDKKPFEYTHEAVTEAMENIVVMSAPTEKGFKLFYVEKENDKDVK